MAGSVGVPEAPLVNAVPPLNVDEIGLAGNWLLRAGVSGASNIGWLAVSPSEGTVESGATSELDVTFDATDMEVGTYTADIVIASNDPVNSPGVVQATLEVTSAPYPFELSPESITLTLETDGMAADQFTIANTTDDEQFFEIQMRSASGSGPNLAQVLPEFERRVMKGIVEALVDDLVAEGEALIALFGKFLQRRTHKHPQPLIGCFNGCVHTLRITVKIR